MPQNPGVLEITFNPPDSFEVDRLHAAPASEGLSSFTQTGCTKQGMSARDKISDTVYAEATAKFYTPYNTNTDGVRQEWYITYGSSGLKYRILGVHRIPDAWGRVDFCKFMCKEEHG